MLSQAHGNVINEVRSHSLVLGHDVNVARLLGIKYGLHITARRRHHIKDAGHIERAYHSVASLVLQFTLNPD
jgi:hypothetical protein